jgi:hypothetical protein
MVANAMNFMMPPDSNWEYIVNLTGDETWHPEEMRRYFTELERVVYLEEGSDPTHGYDGYITVGLLVLFLTFTIALTLMFSRDDRPTRTTLPM